MFFVAYSAHAAYPFFESGSAGFGEAGNLDAGAMAEFNGDLYACTSNSGGVQVWKSTDALTWSKVLSGGFGEVSNSSCHSMKVYDGFLYLGTGKEVDPGEVWRTSDGSSWSQVGGDGFGEAANLRMYNMEVFNGYLYVGTFNNVAGFQIWRTNTGTSFTKVVNNGFGDASNNWPRSMAVFNSYLYVGTTNLATGGELHRTNNGTGWAQVNNDGFGDVNNGRVTALYVHNNELYVGTSNVNGGEVRKSQTASGAGQYALVNVGASAGVTSISTFGERNDLFYVTGDNSTDGAQLFVSKSGGVYAQQNTNGFNDVFNDASASDNSGVLDAITYKSVTLFSISRFVGTSALVYPSLAPTISNLTASERQGGSGYVDISFDVETEDNAADTEAYVEYSVGGAFGKATISTVDANTSATTGDPKVDNNNTNQIGNSSGYVTTASGKNAVTTIWDSVLNEPFINAPNTQVRIRGFSGTNGAFVSSPVFVLVNQDKTPPTTTVSPAGGNYQNPVSVTLICQDPGGSGCDATYYTLDNSTPTVHSLRYNAPFTISRGATLKYFSIDRAGNQETVHTELYAILSTGPVVTLTKTMTATSGTFGNGDVKPGDELLYEVAYENIGSGDAFGFYISDSIPGHTSYISGSLMYNGRAISDRKDVDQGDYSVTMKNNVYFDIGSLKVGEKGTFSFKVLVSNTAFDGDVIDSRAAGAYNPGRLGARSNTIQNTVRAQGSISGLVFNDINKNGVQNQGEGGISGVTVRVYNDNNHDGKIDVGDTLAFTGATGRIGTFDVYGMSAGFYMVSVDEGSQALSNYEPTTKRNPGQVVLKTSLIAYNGAKFGYAAKTRIISRVVPPVVRGILGGPKVPQVTPITPIEEPPVEIIEVIEDTVEDKKDDVIIEDKTEIIVEDKKDDKKEVIVEDKKEEILIDEPQVEEKGFVAAFFEPVWQNESVKRAVDAGLVPLTALVALTNILASVSVAQTLFPYLKYLAQLFSEPFRFFAVKGRRKWGSVYNSLTDEPLDLAIVRLFDKETGKLLESSVTDAKGRYYFLAEKGKAYYMTVTRDGFTFPSHTNSKSVHGGKRVYNGEIFSFDVNEKSTTDGIIAFDVPIDPAQGMAFLDDKYRKPIKTSVTTMQDMQTLSKEEIAIEDKRMVRADRARKISFVFSFLGPLLGLIALVLAPSWFTAVLFVVHILLFFLFRRLAARKIAKPWGHTYDTDTNYTLSKVIVRLFEPRFGRILMARVTNSDGRYGFLVGDDDYVLIPKREGFSFPEGKVPIHGGEKGLVKEDIGLKKG